MDDPTMGIQSFFSNILRKSETRLPPQNFGDGTDMYLQTARLDSILKSVTPLYLYRPPFGYPRNVNVPALRALAKNAYIFSIIKTLTDQAATTKWDIKPREDNEDHGIVPLEEVRDEIKHFLNNPNANDESFAYLIRAAITDVYEVGNAVWIKVFNKEGRLVQLFARDAGSFLKNPDIYGTFTYRSEFVPPVEDDYQAVNSYMQDKLETTATGEIQSVQNIPNYELLKQRYAFRYSAKAAYFQYGYSFSAFPIPFGTREVMYMEINPRTDQIYARSAIEVLSDIILTLIYGSKYNLDFYLNNNMPEGILSIEGAKPEDVQKMLQRMSYSIREQPDVFGIRRKMGYKIAVSPNPTSFTAFQIPPADMQILEQQRWFQKIAMGCFGVNENEMGITEDSNKAVAGEQSKVFIRKALKPVLDLIAYHINTQIITEFPNSQGWEFKWDDYDLDEDIKRHALFESQVRMGIKTPEMVAKEEGIDVDELTKYKDEAHAKQLALMGQQPDLGNDSELADKQLEKQSETKSVLQPTVKPPEDKKDENLNEIKTSVKDIFKTILEELDKVGDEY
jgi:phage portal protein BeeE